MWLLNRMSKEIVALAVLLVYTIGVFFAGYVIAIRVESSAIRMERNVRDLVKMMENEPVEPGWEQCTSDPIKGTNNFVIKLCKEGTTQEDYLHDKAKWR